MIKKFDGELYSPSWIEVILGAVLSVILGGALGALLLVVRPVVTVKELPKAEDRDAKVVYYVEGTRDATRGREAPAKRKAFAGGQSVTVTEDDLNALISVNPPGKAPATPPAPKPAEKGKAADKSGAPAAADGEMLTLGTPNFRIGDKVLQMAVPVTYNIMGVMGGTVLVQTRGVFEKRDNTFVYEPGEIIIGSCPVHRLPYLANVVREKILSQPVPDDIKASWAKLANVAIEGKTLKLTMP